MSAPASTRHKVLALAALAGAVGTFCFVARFACPHAEGAGDSCETRGGASEAAVGEGSSADPKLLDDRLWVDSRPSKHTDYEQSVLFLSEANFGLFRRASSYDMRLEFFDMTRDGRAVHLTFPQTSRAADLRFTVRECSDHKPFDLCLDLSRNPWGGPTHYFGFSKPEDEQQVLGTIAADARADARRRRD